MRYWYPLYQVKPLSSTCDGLLLSLRTSNAIDVTVGNSSQQYTKALTQQGTCGLTHLGAGSGI